MWPPAKIAAVGLLGSIVGCAGAGSSPAGPAPRTSIPTSASTLQAGNPAPLIPKPDVLRFRRGVVDSTGWHGTRDARVYPDGRLAVLTYDGGCPRKPILLTVRDASHLDITYGMDTSGNRACLTFLGPYTAVFKLPRTVNLGRPLAVSVHFGGTDDYTVTARTL
jgi:hypothetical protein